MCLFLRGSSEYMFTIIGKILSGKDLDMQTNHCFLFHCTGVSWPQLYQLLFRLYLFTYLFTFVCFEMRSLYKTLTILEFIV